MKKKFLSTTAGFALILGAVFAPTAVQAGPHHHDHHRGGNNGVRLATDIVRLVGASVGLAREVIDPAPVVVAPAPAPAPVVVAPAPAPVVVAPAPAPVVVAPQPAPVVVLKTRPYRPGYVLVNVGNSWVVQPALGDGFGYRWHPEFKRLVPWDIRRGCWHDVPPPPRKVVPAKGPRFPAHHRERGR